MPTVLQASLSVTVDGSIDLTPYVLDVSWTHDAKRQVAEATFLLSSLPGGVEKWQEVTITAGAVGRYVVPRFGGYVASISRRHWTPSVTMTATGYLGLAGRIKAPTDDEAALQDQQAAAGQFGAYSTWVDPETSIAYITYTPPTVDTSTPAEYQPPGVDLSNDGAGQTDAAIVAQVLDLCGLTSKCGMIGGTGRVLGTQAREQFVWRRSESALDVIGGLDAIALGHRTFDAPDGTIVRALAGPRTPSGTSAITLTEGVDILTGASLDDQTKQIANRVEVSGWNDGSGDKVCVAAGVHPQSLPAGVDYETASYSSRLIEKGRTSEAGDGLSCEEVALWHLREESVLWRKVTIPTWRDDLVMPGYQLTIAADHLISGVAWVESVRCQVSRAKVWRQDVVAIIRADAATHALLGRMTLPRSLAINP